MTATDYYPFGMEMPGRKYNPQGYRYGFNGMEFDKETGAYTTLHRMLDVRLGRWWSLDPITHPWQSPYISMDNNPINLSDPDGDKAMCCNFALAAFEAASEIITQKFSGTSWADIDYADVLVEGLDGLLNNLIPDAVKEIFKESLNVRYDSKNGFLIEVNLTQEAVGKGLSNYLTAKTIDGLIKVFGNVLKTQKVKFEQKAFSLGQNEVHQKAAEATSRVADRGSKASSKQIAKMKNLQAISNEIATKQSRAAKMAGRVSKIEEVINKEIVKGNPDKGFEPIKASDAAGKVMEVVAGPSQYSAEPNVIVFETGGFISMNGQPLYKISSGEFATKENFMKIEKREATDEDRARTK